MATTRKLSGYVYNLSGSALVGLTVNAYNVATDALVATTTTIAAAGSHGSGYWELTGLDDTIEHRVEIVYSASQKIVRSRFSAEVGNLQVVDVLAVPDGAVGAPGVRFAADPDTGLYRSAANTLDIATAGARRAQFASDGRIGLGSVAGAGVNVYVPNQLAANVGLLVRGIASQATDIFRVEDSAAATLFAIDQNGRMRADKFVSLASSLGSLAGVITIKYGVGGASTGYIPVYSSFVS